MTGVFRSDAMKGSRSGTEGRAGRGQWGERQRGAAGAFRVAKEGQPWREITARPVSTIPLEPGESATLSVSVRTDGWGRYDITGETTVEVR